jgi:signal transduction histidine kinase
MGWVDRLHPDDAAGYLEAYRRAEAERGRFEATFRFRRADGEYRWFKSVGRPRFDADGTYRGYVGSSIDITDLREADRRREEALAALQAKTAELRATTQQLWQAARLAGVGELAASIAHELNNPLGTVSLRVEGVLAKTPPDDPRRKPLEVVEQEVERMARLVANLLQFSRAGADKVSTVDVCDEVAKTVELVGHHLRKHQVRVETEFAPGVPPIHADRQQLRQVLLNLFTNAVDAMPGGGRLTPRVRPGALAGRPAVVVEVADTGVGIPPELLPRVSEPFFTTKPEGQGTGLGLAICRRIVQQHQGAIEVESRPGEGTTVRITLPVRPDTNVAGLQAG